MKIIKWIWWFGGPLFGLICIGYAIAFVGWGFSWWDKPQPDAFLASVAFLFAGVHALRASAKEFAELKRKPSHSIG